MELCNRLNMSNINFRFLFVRICSLKKGYGMYFIVYCDFIVHFSIQHAYVHVYSAHVLIVMKIIYKIIIHNTLLMHLKKYVLTMHGNACAVPNKVCLNSEVIME